MAWMLPQTGAPAFHLISSSEANSTCIGLKFTSRTYHHPLQIRGAFCCDTTTVLAVTAIPPYTGKVNMSALRAHSTSLTTFENVEVSIQPIDHHHTKSLQSQSTMDATIPRETLIQNEMAGLAAAAAEAVALAKAAVEAARDVVALSGEQTLAPGANFKIFPSEADLVRLERARLTEMERSGIMKSLDNFKSEHLSEDCKYQFPSSSNPAYPLEKDCNLTQENMTNSSTSSVQKASEIIVKSIRHKERKTRRVGTSNKAGSDPARILPDKPTKQRKKVKRSVSGHFYKLDPSLGDLNHKLLTPEEEVVLAKGIQDLRELDKIRNSYEDKNGREPTLTEWAKAAGVELKAFQRRIHKGRYCKEEFIKRNIRLVMSIGKNYKIRGVSIDEIVEEGTIGLRRAAEKFDWSMGFKFSTYAYWWIKQSIMKAIKDKWRPIRIPGHFYVLLSRIKKTRKLLLVNGRPPTNVELAKAVGIPVIKMLRIIKASKYPKSLDRRVGPNQDLNLLDIIADPVTDNMEAEISAELMRRDLTNFLQESLSEKERIVMEFRYGLNGSRKRSLREIGKLFYVGRERARLMHLSAVRKLKNNYRSKHIKNYLSTKEAETNI